MSIIEHTSRKREYTENAKTHSYTVLGGMEEIFALQESSYAVGKSIPGMGVVKSSTISQKGGKIWALELTCIADDGDGSIEPPNTAWGEKSASLDGSMLSLPLETLENYLTKWNHYLFCHPDIKEVPAWYEEAKDPVLDDKQAQCYAWGMTLNDVPVVNGVKWKILKAPSKPGVNSRDIGVYTITETAKFKSPTAAGNMVAGKLNRIGKPYTTFGISGGDWKCDRVAVRFQNDKWLATLTWTRSGDENGWDKDIYK